MSVVIGGYPLLAWTLELLMWAAYLLVCEDVPQVPLV